MRSVLSPPERHREGDLPLVFIGGFGSGGTDLLKNVVNAHPDVLIAGEFPLLAGLAHEYGPTVEAERAEEVVGALRRVDSYGHLDGAAETLPEPIDGRYSMGMLYRHLLTDRDARWVGNKTPSNTENIAELRTLFPHARFIVIVRDVRDVALSWDRKWGKDKTLCAAKWGRRMLEGRRFGATLPEQDFLLLRYEDLLEDLDSHTRRLCRFLDLDHAPEMLAFHEHVEEVVDGKLNYGRPVIAANRGKWRSALAPHEVRRIEEVAHDGLRAFGYEITQASGLRPIRRWERLRGRLRDAYATVFVGNRAARERRLLGRAQEVRLEIQKRFTRVR